MGKDFNCKVFLSSGDVILDARVANSFFSKLIGIMFQRHFPYSALVFTNCYWMHSFFCFVSFHIVFLDKNFNVIKTFYDVKPNKILSPILNSKYVIEFFDSNIKFKEGDRVIIEKYE